MNKNRLPSRVQTHPGWSLIDALLSIAVVALLGVLIAGLGALARSNTRAIRTISAAAVANDQLAAIQRLDITTVSDQTSGAPLNMVYNAGAWSVVQDLTGVDSLTPCPPPSLSQHCGANVLELPGSASFANKESGRLQFPADTYGDTVLQASWKVVGDSPANWIFGLYFRMTDLRNGYRLRIGSSSVDFQAGGAIQNVIMEKLTNGTASTLYISSGVVNVPTNTWMAFRLTMAGNSFTVTKDGAAFISTVTDGTNPFLLGRAALVGWNGVHARVDDVTTIDPSGCSGSPGVCWNFEAEDILPTAWSRFSVNDLPDVTPTTFDNNIAVTIEPWPVGATDLKRITVVVSWQDGSQIESETAVGYLRKSGIGT